MQGRFRLNEGSDFRAVFNWPDGSGGNLDLTGYTVSAYKPTGLPGTDWITVAVTSASVGEITIDVPWTDAITAGTTLEFRVRVTDGSGFDDTTNQLQIYYQ